MNFEPSDRQREWQTRMRDFMDQEWRPQHQALKAEQANGNRWSPLQVIETLKQRAKSEGLWNLFMPASGEPDESRRDHFEFSGARLSNLEYALCAEELGRLSWASEVFNCSAPDTGNMEVLLRYGSLAQKERWLRPLMNGETRSAFLMTEPEVASSDATNIQTQILKDGNDYVINGHKWWSTGAGHPRCEFAIVMGKSDPKAATHRQQSMILVDLQTPGIQIKRMLPVFGYDHAPHGHAEIVLDNVRVPAENLILGEGRGFEIAQGRLGPGRIHHCMRTIGAAEEALKAMALRTLARSAFGKRLSEQSVWEQRLADARVEIEMTRLLCLRAADRMDRLGNKAARTEISMVKLQAPRMALKIIDDAIQAHGGAGVSDDFGLAADWADIRCLRLADGPDEVHARTVGRAELSKYSGALQ